jgi:hypothetical protein
VFEATSVIGPSFVSDAIDGPPFQVASETLVPHLNVDLLHGLTDAAFAKLGRNNLFSQMQTFGGGLQMPAGNPETNNTNLVDSAPLDFESTFTNSQNQTSMQHFRWVAQPTAGSTAGPVGKLSLSFGANGATPTATGLSINSDGTINFAPNQQFPVGIIGSSGGGSASGIGGSPSNPVVNTSVYTWTQSPPAGIQAGANSVVLGPCPKGVNGTDQWHYLYISGTGTPEIVLITGGSCISRASGGTIEFTADNAHPSGYSIGTATDGFQEAAVDAAVTRTNGQISRQVTIDPGTHLLRARVSIRTSSITINSSGATLLCAMEDTCIMAGDPSNGDQFQAIVLQGLRVAPGVKSGTWPAVEDNAQGSQINNLGPANSPVSGASFGSLVQVDNDQAAVINGLSTTLSYLWGRCDATFCSTAILGPGPFSTNAGVLQVENSNISLQCTGNGIDDQDGNTLKVTDTIVQGYAQFGIRAATVYQPDTVLLNGVYGEEDGNCNPLGTGAAGLIVEGGQANIVASTPAGFLPQYTNTGSFQNFYYVVVHSSTWGTSPAYLAGSANTNGVNGSIKVLWNRIGNEGIITYDLLRISGDGGADMVAPNGTGMYAVATGIPATLCSTQVCSYIDNAESLLSSYTVAAATAVYWPSLKLWPGNVILTSTVDVFNSGGGNPTMLFADSLTSGAIVNSAGNMYPSVFAQECNPLGTWTSIWMQCTGGNSVGNDYPPIVATLLQIGTTGGAPGGLKGRLIFELPPGNDMGATHLIALADSNSAKTLATPDNSPSWDVGDSYIGYDGLALPGQAPVAIGSPVSISNYIANTGDGINFGERLTAAEKQFKVPVQFASAFYSVLAGLSLPDGTLIYCSDCMNIADDGATFDSNAAPGGHGTTVLHENGQWRVH